jgi:hypothetical protein
MSHKTKWPYRSTSPVSKPTSFDLFTYLPTELRLKCWRYASPLPRIIELSWPPEDNSKARSLISRTGPPAVLHACRESRSEFIRNHPKLEFPGSPQVILVDYSSDTIFFGPGCKHLLPSGRSGRWVEVNRKLMRDIIFSPSLTQNLRIAAFDCEFLLALDPEGSANILGLYGALKKLEEVVIVRPEDWIKARLECRRLKSLDVRLSSLGERDMSSAYADANLAYIRPPLGADSAVRKVSIAKVEVLESIEEPSACSRSLPLDSPRRRYRFLKSKEAPKIRSRTSSKACYMSSTRFQNTVSSAWGFSCCIAPIPRR